MEEMTPQQMIDKGIELGDLELIKKGRELEKNVVITVPKKRGGRKKGSKNKPKTISPSKLKPPKFKNDADHIAYLKKMEAQRIDDLIHNRAGPITQPVNLFVDYDGSFKEDAQFDKKTRSIKKHKEPRREAIQYVDVICPRCGRTAKITENEKRMYNFDTSSNVGSDDISKDKPLFSCGQCK